MKEGLAIRSEYSEYFDAGVSRLGTGSLPHRTRQAIAAPRSRHITDTGTGPCGGPWAVDPVQRPRIRRDACLTQITPCISGVRTMVYTRVAKGYLRTKLKPRVLGTLDYQSASRPWRSAGTRYKARQCSTGLREAARRTRRTSPHKELHVQQPVGPLAALFMVRRVKIGLSCADVRWLRIRPDGERDVTTMLSVRDKADPRVCKGGKPT